MKKMILLDVGILGTGLWDGPIIENSSFVNASWGNRKEPFASHRDKDGSVRIAGLVLSPTRHQRTITAVQKSFEEGYRGTKRRRRFPEDLAVSDAEAEAARAALVNAGLGVRDIDVILTQSFLPDNLQPKNAVLLAHKLGTSEIPAWEVDSLCNSVITQCQVGMSLIRSGQAQRVLCVQSVAYSRVTNPQLSTAVLDGDMATAFVLGPCKDAMAAFSWRTDGRYHASFSLQWGLQGSPQRKYYQPAEERLLIKPDDEKLATVMGEIATQAEVVCTEAVRQAEFRLDEVDLFLSHQPFSWFCEFMADTLGLKDGVAFQTFDDYASINSSSIITSLDGARKRGLLSKGSKILCFAPASGNLYGAMAMRWA